MNFRYRGLKSFRSSPWDPSENLPEDYGKIFKFDNIRKTMNKVLKEKSGGAEVYIGIDKNTGNELN